MMNTKLKYLLLCLIAVAAVVPSDKIKAEERTTVVDETTGSPEDETTEALYLFLDGEEEDEVSAS